MRHSSFCKRNILRKFLVILTIFCLFTSSVNIYAEEEDSGIDAPVNAYSNLSFIVSENETKQTLYRQNVDVPADCSLLSRLMVCLLVYENPSLSITSYVSPSEDSTSSSGRYTLYASNQYMIDYLLKSVILCNADNAVSVLADAINPSREYVVMLMNQKALELGMNNTYFTNVDGSHDELQRTTVYDMSVFWSYAMSNILFRNVASSTATNIWNGTIVLNECAFVASEAFPDAQVTAGTSYVYDTESNYSTILFYYTSKAGTDSPPVKLTMVVSGISDDEAYKLGKNNINEISNNFIKKPLVTKDELITSEIVDDSTLSLLAGGTLYCMMPINTTDYIENISYVYSATNQSYSPSVNNANTMLSAPIKKGTIIGQATYLLKDGSTHTVSLVAGNNIHSGSKTVNMFYKLIQENTDIFILISVLLFLELILFFSYIIYNIKKKFKK